VKAFSVTSFGFGQKGAQAIGIHPRYLYAVLDEATYADYKTRVEARQKRTYRYFHNGLINNSLFVAKSHAPYSDDQMHAVFLNPEARVSLNAKTSELTYPSHLNSSAKKPTAEKREATKKMVESLAKGAAREGNKVGVDVEDISAINIENEIFLERNFTDKEQAYCQKAANPQASYAGKWSAKEAVFKSLGVASKGAGAALREIEILNDEKGAPIVSLHGEAAQAAKKAGVKEINISISHSESQAVAISVASF